MYAHVRPAAGVVIARRMGEDTLVLDVAVAEVGVNLADAHRGREIADIRTRGADVDLAGAEIGVDVSERAVDVDRAIACGHLHVDPGRDLDGELDRGVVALRAPALRVWTEVAPHDGFIPLDHDLGGDVVGDLLLLRPPPVPVEVPGADPVQGDAVRGAVADSEFAGRD